MPQTDITVYFDESQKSFQKISTGSTFDGKVKDIAQTISCNWYAFDIGGKLVKNQAYIKPNEK